MGIFDIFFGNKSDKTPARKADSPLIIHYPMQENDHKKAAFQNVVVALKADNVFSEQQKERVEKWGANNGLLLEEMQVVWYQADKLGFVPHDKQGWNHLDIKMMADYAVHSERVYLKSQTFGEGVGVQSFMFAKLFLARENEEELEKIKDENLSLYSVVKKELERVEISDKELAKILREAKQEKNFTQKYSENQDTNKAIYRLLWLVFLHSAWLNKETIHSLTGICMSIESGREKMETIWEMLRSTESNFGKVKVPLLEKTEAELMRELSAFWQHS